MVEIVVQILRPLPRSATQERPFHREPPTLPSTHHVQVSAIGKDGNMDARPLIVRILTICTCFENAMKSDFYALFIGTAVADCWREGAYNECSCSAGRMRLLWTPHQHPETSVRNPSKKNHKLVTTRYLAPNKIRARLPMHLRRSRQSLHPLPPHRHTPHRPRRPRRPRRCQH